MKAPPICPQCKGKVQARAQALRRQLRCCLATDDSRHVRCGSSSMSFANHCKLPLVFFSSLCSTIHRPWNCLFRVLRLVSQGLCSRKHRPNSTLGQVLDGQTEPQALGIHL